MTSANRRPDTIFEYVGENIDNWRTPQDIFLITLTIIAGRMESVNHFRFCMPENAGTGVEEQFLNLLRAGG